MGLTPPPRIGKNPYLLYFFLTPSLITDFIEFETKTAVINSDSERVSVDGNKMSVHPFLIFVTIGTKIRRPAPY